MNRLSLSPPLWEWSDVPLEEWVQYPASPAHPGQGLDPRALDFLVGLRGFGVVFIDLVPNTKRPARSWESFISLMARCDDGGLGNAIRWLKDGHGLGFLPHGGLWVLDVDGAAEVESVLSQLEVMGIETPSVRTPSGGRHFYFRWPELLPRAGLKNHICHPKDAAGRIVEMDFKFGPRTLLVAPGTHREGRVYEPMTAWFTPPQVDPRTFLSDLKIWRDSRRFLIDPRPFPARVARACNYLHGKAPLSISGHGGRKALMGVSTHLVAFLGLSPWLAVHLMTHGQPSWNARCADSAGYPCPWDLEDLYRACTEAVDGVPEAGVKLWRRGQARAYRDKSLSTFFGMVTPLQGKAPGRILAMDLRQIFEQWSGAEVTADAFGRAARRSGLLSKLATKARLKAYFGLDAVEVKYSIRRHPHEHPG